MTLSLGGLALRRVLWWATISAAVAGCGTVDGKAPPPPPPPVVGTYCNNASAGSPKCDLPGFDIRQELQGCAGDSLCHSGPAAQLGFEIDTTAPGSSPADWLREYINTPGRSCAADVMINPSDPDCSLILTKVTPMPKCGVRMPNRPEDHYDQDTMDCFRKWMHDAFGTNSDCASAGGDGDGDGVCDNVDACIGFNDNIDVDQDGTPDGCDLCVGLDTSGDSDSDGVCDDRDVCLGDDATGDADTDGVCDDQDLCAGDDTTGDTDMDGVCDDMDTCVGDDATGDADTDGVCDDTDVCVGDDSTGDADTDGVCDDQDQCPGFDDNIDLDMNGTPDGCDP